MDGQKKKLYQHQVKFINGNHNKYLLAWGCGSGKTLAVLEMIKKKKASAIIITPKSLKHQWLAQTSHLVVTKEEFKRDWDKLPYFDCCAIDEFHFFLGMTGFRKMSGMLKALLSYIKKHNPPYIYGLTATPYMSSPLNIYACAKILGRDWSYSVFHNTFFSMVNMGMRWPVPVVKKGIEPQIAKLVNSLGSTVKLEDCFDVPEQTFLTEYFDLTKEQKTAIAELEDEGIARWTKIHQICGGTLKGNGYTANAVYKSEKMDRIVELCEEHKKIVVVCRYNHELESLQKIIWKGDRKILTINGMNKNRANTVELAEKLEDCVLLVQASCSEGYEIPSFPIMVFYSYDFSLKNYIQMIGRILRANKLKKNVYISLVVKKTIDEDVFKCINNKKDFDIAIYDKG